MSTRRVVLRFLLAFVGGYGFSAAASSALASLFALAGVVRAEAAVFASMLGFLVYLVVLLWAFAARSPRRVALLLLGGSACAYGVAQLGTGLSEPLLSLATRRS
ncbi:MAG: hypothetical protein RL685_540 [Pseudomonadota bacterium]|jgi:hypothetical protein